MTARPRGRRDGPPAPASALEPAAMAVQRVPLTALQFDPTNARVHNPRNLQAMRESLSTFGQRRPVVAQRRTGRVIAGNGLVQSAADLGWTHVDVHFVDMPDDQARAFAIADNRVGELSYFDDLVLAEQLATLPEDLVAVLGFDVGDMERLAELVGEASGEAAGAPSRDGRALMRKAMRGKVILRLTLAMANTEPVERALTATGLPNREDALLRVCQHFIDTKGLAP